MRNNILRWLAERADDRSQSHNKSCYTVKLQYVYVKNEPKNTNTAFFQTL